MVDRMRLNHEQLTDFEKKLYAKMLHYQALKQSELSGIETDPKMMKAALEAVGDCLADGGGVVFKFGPNDIYTIAKSNGVVKEIEIRAFLEVTPK